MPHLKAHKLKSNWMRCRPYLLVALCLAGCRGDADSNPTLQVPQAEVTARFDGRTRGLNFSQARACGADPAKVAALAAQEPPPPGATPTLTAIYREAFNSRLNAVITSSTPETCAATQRDPAFASLFPASSSPKPTAEAETAQEYVQRLVRKSEEADRHRYDRDRPSDVAECRSRGNASFGDIILKYRVMDDCLLARRLRRQGR